ncbi:MAG: discoidin domain-containing protein [Spirochaetales bacterium]|nr:discoidin domain-containing protein [Spirochaetales bacterium]
MRKIISHLILFSLFIMSCTHTKTINPENSPRRPCLGNGTVLTSYGTMLRGVYWSLDEKGEVPDRESVREIKDFGMNALHVYAERHDSGVPAGSYVEQLDTIVQWCGEDGLYCVITIGCGNHNGMFDIDFARLFWNTYAPRYKDKPWVIYEIYNEPYTKWKPPYDKETLAMEQEMYHLIRKLAPDTMILLFSYAGLSDTRNIITDIKQLKVDWSNAAVAFHGYGSITSENMRKMKEAGLNSICTELPISSSFSDEQVNPGHIYMCEKNEISWLVFIQIKKGYLDSWRFKQEIDKRNLGWTPDFGKWPAGPSPYVPPLNLALGKRTIVSSVENYKGSDLLGTYATDGDDNTRWGSGFADNQYIIVDFEKSVHFDKVVIKWESQYAVKYDILISDDMDNWERISGKTHGTGGGNPVYNKERISVYATARYLKVFLKKRRMQYGFSMYELEVFDTTND